MNKPYVISVSMLIDNDFPVFNNKSNTFGFMLKIDENSSVPYVVQAKNIGDQFSRRIEELLLKEFPKMYKE